MGNKTREFFIIYVAYNEEKSLLSSFLSTKKSIDYYLAINSSAKANVLICHNGCKDKTPEICQDIKKQFNSEKVSIDVISSSKGMVIAQNKCIDYIRQKKEWKDSPLIFVDADSFLDENAIAVIIDQLEKFPKLRAVGIQPKPISYRGFNLYKKLLDHTLNCRAYFPKSEIAINYAPQFHPYADVNKQIIGSDFEKKSKIYFHGRCFSLKNQAVWDVPIDSIGEDTYLDRSIHYRFGPGSIRNIFDVYVSYKVITNLKTYLKIYYRIHRDLYELKIKNPQFDNNREFSKTKLDWQYIKTLSWYWIFIFSIYYWLRKLSQYLFKNNLIFRHQDIKSIWSYNNK